MQQNSFQVKKWVRSQTALKETVTFDKLLQHAKQHEATVKDFHRHKSNGGVATSTTINEIRTFKRKMPRSLEPEPYTRSKGKVCGKCWYLSFTERVAQPLAKNVINVEIRIILVHNAGPNSQEEGTDGPTAHPEDGRVTRTNVNNPG